MGNARSKLEPLEDTSKKPLQNEGQSAVTIPRLDTDVLLEPPDETSIKRSWVQLSNLIDAHVENFYNPSEYLDLSRESIINGLRICHIIRDPREAGELAELLQIPRYRKLGLRVCIARAVLSSIDFYGLPEYTSLDRNIVELLGRFNRLRPNPSPEEEAALSHWRMITAFFLAPGSKDPREARLPCVVHLTNFLAKFRPASDISDTETESRNWTGSLNVIAQQGIDIGEKLFCHPSTWFFEWHAEATDKHPSVNCRENPRHYADGIEVSTRGLSPIVLFPALIETLGGDGTRKTERFNVAQAADIGPGLVFLQGEIIPLSVVLSHRYSSPAASVTTHTTSTIATVTDTMRYGAEYEARSSSRRRGDISSGMPSGAPPPSPPSSIRPVRRSSTLNSVSRRGSIAEQGIETDYLRYISRKRERNRSYH